MLNTQQTIGEIEMMTLTQLTEWLGWASILNIGFLIIATILLVVMRPLISKLHSKIFDVPDKDLLLIYFKYLANYKMLIFIFILIPYISLKIMES